MKRFLIFLFSLSLHAATYYVSSTGNDSNPGTASQPWLTVFNSLTQMHCGDTLIVVANGQFVKADANLPYFPNCTSTTTIQSSKWNLFTPAGYRTNPQVDSANYGKMRAVFQGIIAQPGEGHGAAAGSIWHIAGGPTNICPIASVNSTTFTAGCTASFWNLANGTQVVLDSYGSESVPYGIFDVPYPFVLGLRYFVVNCSGCGTAGGTFQLAATPGGTPITGIACNVAPATVDASGHGDGNAVINVVTNASTGQIKSLIISSGGSGYTSNFSAPILGTGTGARVTLTVSGGGVTGYTNLVGGSQYRGNCANTSADLALTIPLQITAGSSTITSMDNIVQWANGTPLVFSAAGSLEFGVLPTPLQTNAIYYIVGLSGNSFSVASTPGGPPITLTNVGFGQLVAVDTKVPNNWAFRGLEFADNNFAIFGFINMGMGIEAGTTVGIPHHFEIDHSYFHEGTVGETQPPRRAIFDNAAFVYIHDSYCTGILLQESQCISGLSSSGPTVIANNFLAAAGEDSLYGGGAPLSGGVNANKLFLNNYYTKPPEWRVTVNNTGSSATPIGACWYDTTDFAHAGGEWYQDLPAAQWYQCGSDHAWHTTTSTPSCGTFICGNPSVKNLAEHKNGRYFTYTGNYFNYVWTALQAGEAFNLAAEFGSGAGASNDHISVVGGNAIYNVYQMNIARQDYCGSSLQLAPCLFNPVSHAASNILAVSTSHACGVSTTSGTVGCGFPPWQNGWDYYGVSMVGDFQDHVTVVTSDSGYTSPPSFMHSESPNGSCPFFTPFPAPAIRNENFQNSISSGDPTGSCVAFGNVILYYFGNSTFTHSVLKGATAGVYSSVGATNTWSNIAYPVNNAAIGFVNPTGDETGDYHLANTSPYSAQNGSATLLSIDGTDLGADIDLVNMATSGAKNGVPNWDQQAHLQVDAASTQVVFRYTAPTGAACVATAYSASARISANQVVSVADSAASSIQNGLERNLYISGLTPSNQYWYKLTCGGGVTMVGKFWTRPGGSGTYPMTFQWSNATPMRYSTSASMTSPTSLSAAITQLVPVTANSVVYAQVGTTGPITVLVAP